MIMCFKGRERMLSHMQNITFYEKSYTGFRILHFKLKYIHKRCILLGMRKIHTFR